MKQLALLLVAVLAPWSAQAVERKAPADVDMAMLSRQIQTHQQADGIRMAIWWPPEFWAAALAHNPNVPPEGVAEVLKILGRYSLVGIVHAQTGQDANITFLDRASISKNLDFEWAGPAGDQRFSPLAEIPQDLKPLFEELNPMMRSAFGEMGKNLHVFVIVDPSGKNRKMNPYEPGALRVRLSKEPRDTIVIESPIDALFVPRLCPNGKPAHVTWKVCPWGGEKLPD